MKLEVYIGDEGLGIEIEPDFIEEAKSFFDKMDGDMDAGWQLGREWIEHPDQTQRGQIVADKLLTALDAKDELMIKLSAGYILERMPEVAAVTIDNNGEPQVTSFHQQPLSEQ